MPECPPGVHSIFDPCPGNCTEPPEGAEYHTVNGQQYFCYTDDHYCPPGAWPPKG